MIRVLLADDHVVLRDGLRHILEAAGDFRIVGEAGDGEATLALVSDLDADVLVLDLSMPGSAGIELIAQVRGAAPQLRVLVSSMHAQRQVAGQAFRAGASGYLTKDCASTELVDALREIARGGLYLSTNLADPSNEQPYDGQDSMDRPLPHHALTAREYEVMQLIVSGQTVTQIAESLQLSPKTVSTHRTNLLAKMGFTHDAALIRYALRYRLFENDSQD
jgi:DNA-binding NarL/FixJ family response regulator